MQQLDQDRHNDTCSLNAYTVIGGKSSNLTRRPSYLMECPNSIPEKCGRSRRNVRSPKAFPLCGGATPSGLNSSNGRDETDSVSRCSSMEAEVLRWSQEDVEAWLTESGFKEYETIFKDHAIRCGRSLISLTEEHLKEMGVAKIGHRLELMQCIEQLRKEAAIISREKYADINFLLMQLNGVQLDKTLQLYPHRIILIRHGESEGNVNTALYAVKPDRNMELTSEGIKQAYAAGVQLKKVLAEESVCFYVSPFVRSRQTFSQIRQSFHDEQVIHVREDPRIREQEWGNFQDPLLMKDVMDERRKVGSFYYRFPTGESGADVYDRVSTFLETMYRDMEKGGCGENAIIVSHGLFCRLFLMRYYHWKVEKFHKLWNFENCQYAVMELQPEGRYRLISELKSDL